MEGMNGYLDLSDLTPIEVKVKYNGKMYILREPSEDAVKTFRNHTFKHLETKDGKVVGAKDGFADNQVILVSKCLYEADAEENLPLKNNLPDSSKLVSIANLNQWPNRIVEKLFEKAKEIGGLNEEEETIDSIREEIAKLNKKLAEKVKESERKKSLSESTETASV